MTYEATRQHVQTLVGVDEGLISETLIDLYSKQGIVAEPAGAASIASLEVLAEYIKGKTIVVSSLEEIMISTYARNGRAFHYHKLI